jgi:hypothetical protein
MTIALMLAAGRSAAKIDSSAGTATGSFLQMGGGARSLAMGGTGAALMSDPSAIWTNPGQVAGLTIPEFTFTHGQYVEDVTLNQMVFAGPLPAGVVCVGLTMVEVGAIDSYDSSGAAAGTVEPKDTGITAGYAVEAGKAGVGGSATFINSQLASDAKASAVAVDLGGRYAVLPSLTLSLAAQHLGPSMKFGTKSSSLPMVIRGGVAGVLLSGRLRLAGDVVKPADSGAALLAGAEVSQDFANDVSLSLRGGWKSVAPQGGNAAVSAGGGLRWRPKVPLGRDEEMEEAFGARDSLTLSGIRVDYAWTPMGELGTAHWLSFSLAF